MDFNADRNLMVVRTAMCQVVPEQCPPLSWTLSNRLADYAPYQLQWYFRHAAAACLLRPAHTCHAYWRHTSQALQGRLGSMAFNRSTQHVRARTCLNVPSNWQD